MRNALLAIPAALALAACGGGISVKTDFEPGADFAKYSTYAWIQQPAGEGGTGIASGLADQRIRSAIDANLAAKGLRKVDDPSKAGLAVGYQVTTKDEVSYNTVNTGWGGGYRWGGWGVGMGTSTTYANTYTSGTLIVGLFDTAEKKMVWQGTATKTLDEDATPEERTQNINAAVAKIFEKYPPGS